MAFDADKELEEIMRKVRSESNQEDSQVHIVSDEPLESQKKDDTEYYSGEVYFAAKRPVHPVQPERPAGIQQRKPQYPTPRPRQPQRTGRRYSSKTRRPVQAGAKGQGGFTLGAFIKQNGTKGAIIYVAVLVAISALFSIYAMSFINDIFAFNRSDEVITVKVSENMTTNKLINQFKKQGLIKRKGLCKMFMTVAGGMHKSTDFDKYLSGVYDLKPSMGLEKMLLSCQEEQKSETVTVTIPEGFNIQQIAMKLEKANVCTSADFYKNLESATFEYDFLAGIENKSSRYNYLEGYLYPDTYEFYVGQSASSVIRKLLENTDKKWTKEYANKAKELGMSMDEVLTMASIIQKEAGDAEQMPIIASVFYNRLKSSSFRCLQSDATTVYVAKFIKPNVSVGEADTFSQKYDTYKCIGLPAGPICCPGDDAIYAVLWPAETDYYFFGHDTSGNMYAAKTEAERNAMMYKAVVGGEEDDG